MSKIKMVFWLLVVGLIAVVFFQNPEPFMAKQSLRLFKYQSPQLYAAVFFLAFFVAGFLVAYIYTLPERYRLKKAVKHLTAAQVQANVPVGPAPLPEARDNEQSAPEARDNEKSADDAEPDPEKPV